jgi:hypothetical protein
MRGKNPGLKFASWGHKICELRDLFPSQVRQRLRTETQASRSAHIGLGHGEGPRDRDLVLNPNVSSEQGVTDIEKSNPHLVIRLKSTS